MTTEELLKRWLRGTTCFRKDRSIFWHKGNFVIMRHGGHNEWGGRFSGTEWCETYYAMYDLRTADKIDVLGEPCLKKWTGRWSKAKQAEAEALAT